MNTADPLHLYADARFAPRFSTATPISESPVAAPMALPMALPNGRDQRAEIAALFALAAFLVLTAARADARQPASQIPKATSPQAITSSSKASQSGAPRTNAPAQQPAQQQPAQETQKPSVFAPSPILAPPQLTDVPAALATTRASHHAGGNSSAIVVRRSTRATMPDLAPLAVQSSLVPASLFQGPEVQVPRVGAPRVFATQVKSKLIKSTPEKGRTFPQPAAQLTWIPIAPKNTLPARTTLRASVPSVRIIRAAQTREIPLSALPAATNPPRVMPSLPVNELAKIPAMGKVISVDALKLPQVSGPLPRWNPSKIIPVDTIGNTIDKRLAQNGAAPPLRQPARPVTNSDRLSNQLEVSTGTFVVILNNSDLDTVAIADPSVADVAVVSSRAVLVNGKAPGVTSLVIVDRNRIRQYQVRVTPAVGTRPPDVAAAIGLPGIAIRPLRDALVLEGEVENAEEMRRAVEIAGIFSPRVINHLTLRGAPTGEAAVAGQIQAAINLPNVTVTTLGDSILLQGTVENASQRQRAELIAGRLSKNVLNLIETPRLTIEQVRDTLSAMAAQGATPGLSIRQVGDQIILDGTVATQAIIDEAVATSARSGLQVVNRLRLTPALTAEATLLNSITAAINIPGVHASGTAKRIILTGIVPDTNMAVMAAQIARSFAAEVDNMLETPYPILVNVDVSIAEINRNKASALGVAFPGLGAVGGQNVANIGLGASQVTTFGSTFAANLQALVTSGNARILQNPRTTVLSGRTATFQVGGQIPVPTGATATPTGTTVGITFKDFGVLIDIVPVATRGGVVTMRVRTEVSAIDESIPRVAIGNGILIPAFTRRTTVTEVTVAPGGTIALGGLIANTTTKTVRALPVLSKIPFLGSLFTSKQFLNNQSELAIFVTPRVLPNSLLPGQLAPADVYANGNTTNVGTTLGNPGISSFNSGASVTGSGGGASSGGSSQ